MAGADSAAAHVDAQRLEVLPLAGHLALDGTRRAQLHFQFPCALRDSDCFPGVYERSRDSALREIRESEAAVCARLARLRLDRVPAIEPRRQRVLGPADPKRDHHVGHGAALRIQHKNRDVVRGTERGDQEQRDERGKREVGLELHGTY